MAERSKADMFLPLFSTCV
ncbi:hypothetical protein EYZ11_005548 [Aspergillus tanneri]|uniref:Uncharacterized protein n=1 Tax=Aspergillus tanneri TaxID=1220188 RepID=A0A4V3UPF3_9EURO|nr:hypothetical protein EYZ11_005548 [Aspergillus tanneri]